MTDMNSHTISVWVPDGSTGSTIECSCGWGTHCETQESAIESWGVHMYEQAHRHARAWS